MLIELRTIRRFSIVTVLCIFLSYGNNTKAQVRFAVTGGSKGLGVGLIKKTWQITASYRYEYLEDGQFHVYYHYPSAELLKKFYSKNKWSLLGGVGYTNRIYKQKYFFPGTYNTYYYQIELPIVVRFEPFTEKYKGLSCNIAYAFGIEHDIFTHKRIFYNMQLAKVALQLMYQF